MGIYIKRMEMPENCIECPLRKGTVCDAFQLIQPYTFKDDERAAFCPMTEVPEPKTGKWVIHDEVKNIYGGIYIECSECGTKFVTQTLEDEHFCRNCGADMGGKKSDD